MPDHKITVTVSGNFTLEQAREALGECLFGDELFKQMPTVPASAAEYVGMVLDEYTGDKYASIDMLD
ncbi:Uncharacterised protein (plasmid) [Tsukamurella tyrosinosolvens]|uniref:Uncharacterized protein n=1 Tax=Tsukamurella tyrosinosolvens TaxID=57704 RepID=A0A1H4UKK4_TSUTY|nr:hypothetical protein [Tsukamurella tyrosinosolvens]KXO99054.1 hypothetical protein AXK58_24170 [Tsukamurella tyrosinosolvens]SEC69299.1 hypothetical protein SAMN04489793_2937 [Tsukamurella tyrosinosolvens]VEH94317.1 Uncharacterised protein [Tsukamurella tyrosinosolvens]